MEKMKMRMSRCLKLTGRMGRPVEIRSGAVDCGLWTGLWTVEGSRESRIGGGWILPLRKAGMEKRTGGEAERSLDWEL